MWVVAESRVANGVFAVGEEERVDEITAEVEEGESVCGGVG